MKGHSTQANTYSYQTPPKTQEITDYKNWNPTEDPGIQYGIGNARNRLQDSIQNPQGAYTTPAIRDAVSRTGNENLTQLEGELHREGHADVNRQEQNKLAGIAGLTAPQLVQSGSTTTQSGGVLNSIIGAGASVGSAAIM